uniref:Eukaryotic translation initiation factor 4E family member 2 n=1 Tax=Rhinopithecus roxellana TaxID=61622 RepID=A0A2K6Q5G9_RHIRO
MNNKFDALKDDDNGDHDQNEESKWDKNKSSNKRKAVQFWRFYSHMVCPKDLTGHSDFHIFKEGIKPMWEDNANKNGDKRIIWLPKGLISHWEQFMVGEEICGAVTASDQATTAQIRDTLWRVLNLSPNTVMKYKAHIDSIKMPGRLGPQRLLFKTSGRCG